MMMNADTILGTATDPQFAGRMVHHADIGWGDASKHRQRVTTDAGSEVLIQLPRGSFLYDGAVLSDDGANVVAVRRPAEPAIRVRFADNSGRALLILGHLLGNQHAPVDVDEEGLTAPLFTSTEAAKQLLADLGLVGEVGDVVMARKGWSRTSADNHAGHHH
ncbi:urease accessory protein UreE [Mycobacterium dioxanotrophicus]|uniref:Urease accessory protein UreE n=1 Tax=Mycobacterium dioxanotrophicus TaxID=482462 RepID=A0A1Y0C4C4_9MYCO|nr:urease accessory protein UreE [Mycobacterium dioxanotrophicus]ART70030.1 urease accessory protein UreE [Mycobacterium dioxanotrophicus]